MDANEDELKLAKTLVDSLSTTLDKIELKDRYQNAMKEIIDSKIEGKEIVTYEEEEKPVVDIMSALKQSIAQAKEQKKPMKKATGKKTSPKKQKTVKAKAS